jgi:hypothetical protein
MINPTSPMITMPRTMTGIIQGVATTPADPAGASGVAGCRWCWN